MNKELSELFDVDISEEDVINCFDDSDWEKNTVDAAFYGAVALSEKANVKPEDMIRRIIRYNVLKKFSELFVSKSKPLPTSMIWDSQLTESEAFYLLENYISYVVLLKQAEILNKPVHLALSITSEELCFKFEAWCLSFQQEYISNLNIKYKKLKKNKYNLTLF